MDRIDFQADEPGPGDEDLLPILEMVGDARVVGLGECAHGSREVDRTKRRIVKLLAEKLGFSAVVLEANVAEVARVNEYSLEGRGDPAELLRRHLYWGVSTEEMVELLEWMWRWNTSGGRRQVLLAGCDMQRIDTAAEIVKQHVIGFAPDLAESVVERYERVLDADRVRWLSGMGVQAWFPIEEARGRRLMISGAIRTEDVSDHACIWAWAGGKRGTLDHDALKGRRPRGTTRWREYRVEIDVPEAARHVSFGCSLAGNGTAWFDGLSIEIDGEPWQPPESLDLGFATGDLRGFWVDPRNRATLDPDVRRKQEPSLRIEPAAAVPACDTSDLEALALARDVLAELEKRFAASEAGKALRCARAVVQGLEMRTGGGDAGRARSMAENVEWFLDRKSGNRVVFWSDNRHIARGGGETGAFLDMSLGDDYLPVGFATGEGSCLTRAPHRPQGVHTHTLASPPAGSFEQRLTEASPPNQILDLRTVDASDPEWGWMAERRPFRNVGDAALRYEFFDQRIRDDFDLLVWIEKTSAARLAEPGG